MQVFILNNDIFFGQQVWTTFGQTGTPSKFWEALLKRAENSTRFPAKFFKSFTIKAGVSVKCLIFIKYETFRSPKTTINLNLFLDFIDNLFGLVAKTTYGRKTRKKAPVCHQLNRKSSPLLTPVDDIKIVLNVAVKCNCCVRVWVPCPTLICMGDQSKRKNYTKQAGAELCHAQVQLKWALFP